MKKYISLLLIMALSVTMVFTLGGCKKEEPEDDDVVIEEEQEEEYVPEVTDENSDPSNVVVTPSDDTASSEGITFEKNSGAKVVEDTTSVTVYINGSVEIPYYYVFKMDLNGQNIDDIYASEIENVGDQYSVRIVKAPAKGTISGNGRTLTGITYSFSSEDGSNVIKAIDYIDQVDDNTAYRWVGFYYDDSDLAKMKTAIASFKAE